MDQTTPSPASFPDTHPLLTKALQQLWPYALIALGFALRHYLPGVTLPPNAPVPAPITTPAPTQPAAPAPAPGKVASPLAATAKILMRDGFCSCTFIGPQKCPGRWDVLCAAHCFRTVGENTTIIMRDGTQIAGVVASIDRRADYAWVVVTSPVVMPFLELASGPPAVGSDVWCVGYGPPANGEVRNGSYLGGVSSGRQSHYRLIVYHGDSGSAVVDTKTGKVIGIVCTTNNGDTFGATATAAAAGRPATCPNVFGVELPGLTG